MPLLCPRLRYRAQRAGNTMVMVMPAILPRSLATRPSGKGSTSPRCVRGIGSVDHAYNAQLFRTWTDLDVLLLP